MLVAAVLFGVLGAMSAKARAQVEPAHAMASSVKGVLDAIFAKARAQQPGEEPEDGSQEHEGPPDEIPPYPEDLLPDEDRFLTENEEPPAGTYVQPEAPEASLSMPFMAKVSIVIVVLIVALIVIVLRKSTVPMS